MFSFVGLHAVSEASGEVTCWEVGESRAELLDWLREQCGELLRRKRAAERPNTGALTAVQSAGISAAAPSIPEVGREEAEWIDGVPHVGAWKKQE